MGFKRKTSLLASALMLSANFLMPASTFATGEGTGGLSFYDYLASNADKDTAIDFNQAPATGNVVDEATGTVMSDIGGLYMLQSTKDDDKPMYFYRGNVTDNNVILNNFCWLMVRTTETGGTKLLYNGAPTSDGQCLGDPDWTLDNFNPDDKSTWPGTIVGFSAFNEQHNSPADFGYMYGDRYESTSKSFTSDTVFGNDVTYSNGQYTLQDTVTGLANSYNAHHYTCLSTSTTCSEVYYEVYRWSATGSNGCFLTFTDGDTLETALAKMAENKHDSTIKTFIENWYTENMTDATDYLEDTIWYGSKTFASGALSTKDSNFGSNFDQRGVSYTDTMLDIYYHGANRADDSSLSNSDGVNAVNFDYTDENGIYTVANGTLKYPVGMLTNSEMIMAGNGLPAYAKGTYIDDNFLWWGLSPFGFIFAEAYAGHFFEFGGYSDSDSVGGGVGVRPSVSLKSTLGANSGDGSKEHPFTNLEVADSTDNDGEEETPAKDESTPANPQTADVFLLAAVTIIAFASAAFVAVKRNTSR